MYYISLGSTCGLAYQFQKLGIKRESLPFDWIKCQNLVNIEYFLKNNFDSFGLESDLKLCRESTKHPVLLTDDWSETLDNEGKISIVYQNSHGARFFHDFERAFVGENDPIYITFKEKYQRRFQRLYQLFDSGEKLIFVRDEHKPHNIIPDQIIGLVKWIKDRLTNGTTIKFTLIINNPKKKVFTWESKLQEYGIKIVNDIEKIVGWQRDNLNWKTILEI